MQAFFEFVKSLGVARMAAMAAVTLALIGFFSFLMIQMTTPQMVPLFTDLSVDDSASIIKDLERQAVPYQIKNDGAIIMVPKDKVARLRMKLAESGLPKGGGVGYEIFDKSDALGATTFVQNINHLRALEGELARTIRSIDRVQAARVHLVLTERPLFSRDKVDASAPIVLKVRGALEPQQLPAIRHLVATAVNGLKPERVSVIDETGRLLADGATPDNPLNGVSSDERKLAYENRPRSEVETIVSSVVGPGRARVQINADFDVNRITQTSDKFDPDGRVVRSSQTREEQSATGDGKEGAVSVGTELPGGAANRPQTETSNRDQSRKTEEIVNMWEKLANVQEEVLANYLKNEYPQTVAVVLSKLRPEHAARVLSILPEELSLDCVNRMLKMEAVQKEVIERVEQTLRTEFMSNLSPGVDGILSPDGARLDQARGTDIAAQAAMAVEQVTRNLVGRTVAEVERDLILETLKHCLGNRTHAANILGISIRTLRNKLNEYAADGSPIPPPHGGSELRGAA